MNEKTKAFWCQLEENLSPERKKQLDQVEENINQFIANRSNETVEEFVQRLERNDQIGFIAIRLRSCYKAIRHLKEELY